MAALVDSMQLAEEVRRSEVIDSDTEALDDEQWIVPSEIDCLGRPLAKTPFPVVLRRALSPSALFATLRRLLWSLFASSELRRDF